MADGTGMVGESVDTAYNCHGSWPTHRDPGPLDTLVLAKTLGRQFISFDVVELYLRVLAKASGGSFHSNSRVRAETARAELSWIPRHDSALDWIHTELDGTTK